MIDNKSKVTIENVLKEYFDDDSFVLQEGDGDNPKSDEEKRAKEIDKKYESISKMYSDILTPFTKSLSTVADYAFSDYLKVFRDLDAGVQQQNQNNNGQQGQTQDNGEQSKGESAFEEVIGNSQPLNEGLVDDAKHFVKGWANSKYSLVGYGKHKLRKAINHALSDDNDYLNNIR